MPRTVLLVVAVAACSSAPTTGDDTVDTVQPTDCIASDASSLRGCMEQVLAGTTSRIAITSDITCAGPDSCHLRFAGVAGPAVVFGAKPDGTNAVLHRVDHFDYHLIEIDGSANLEFRDLDLQEGERNQPSGLFGTSGYDVNASCDVAPEACKTAVALTAESHDIVFDHVSILESKGQGMEIGNVDRVTVRNSEIRHAWANGIWTTSGTLEVPNEHVPYHLRLENNLFVDNRCSAIELSGAADSVISGNVLRHNHMGSIYHVPGGQLAIEMNTSQLTIVDNEIEDGRIDEDAVLASQGWLSVGIEFTDSHVHGVTIDHNYIHDVTGGGIIHDPPPAGATRSDFGPIAIANNVFQRLGVEGGLVNFDPPDLTAGTNCSEAACTWQRPTGTLTPSAQTCAGDPMTGLCSLTLSWSTADARSGVAVVIDGATFATGPTGSQAAPWISARPARFDLYDGDTLLDSVRLRAE